MRDFEAELLANGDAHLCAKHLPALMRSIAVAMKEWIHPRDLRLAELERLAKAQADELLAVRAELAELRLESAGPLLRDAGIWKPARAFRPGDVVTRSGWWVCTKAHISGPEFDHSCWRLAVKSAGRT